MNNLIREIAQQAGFSAFESLDERIKIFAELIINECANQTKWSEYEMSSEQRIRLAGYHSIREHFGVE